jgi:hypothetical protein
MFFIIIVNVCNVSLFMDIDHRENGNRIMHEFLLGQKNITRELTRKTAEYEQ